MKKVLLGILAVVLVFSLVACGEKPEVKQNETVEPVQEKVEEIVPVVEEPEEQVGVGNTDEGMVALVLEQHFKDAYPDAVEEVVPTNIKVYSEEEIAANEALKDYTINDGDIVFDAEYELKIADDFSGELMMFTAGTGDIDGQWIKHKSNVGIARSGENGYTLDAFGTAF